MRKGLLAILGALSGLVMLLIFAVCITFQCITVQGTQVLQPVKQTNPFPRAVTDTELFALQLVRYEGPFWEDNSNETVAGVAALVIENRGCILASFGAVVLEWEKETLVFEFSALPAGERVLVLEKDRQPLPGAPPEKCYGWTRGEYPENMGHVVIEENGGASIEVINKTSGQIPVVQICYKTRDRGSGMLLGGISYTVEVRNLRPRERRLLTPYHYICGNSTVVRILTYVE